MPRQRTTVAAEAADLSVLREEARRRGVSLATVLSEAVADAAARLRADRRPRIGLGHSGVGAARLASERADEPLQSAECRT